MTNSLLYCAFESYECNVFASQHSRQMLSIPDLDESQMSGGRQSSVRSRAASLKALLMLTRNMYSQAKSEVRSIEQFTKKSDIRTSSSGVKSTPKLLQRVEQLKLLSKLEDAGLLSLGN